MFVGGGGGGEGEGAVGTQLFGGARLELLFEMREGGRVTAAGIARRCNWRRMPENTENTENTVNREQRTQIWENRKHRDVRVNIDTENTGHRDRHWASGWGGDRGRYPDVHSFQAQS